MICKLIFLHIFVALFSAVTGKKCKPEVGLSENRYYEGRHKGDHVSCECGISHASNAWEEFHRIVGGTVVEPHYKYPWMVALYTEKERICGGSIITQTFVLTAAHCFQTARKLKSLDKCQSFCHTKEGKKVRCFKNASLFRIAVHVKDITKKKLYKLKRYIKHPRFKLKGVVNDFALIELKRPIGCSPYSRPICLPDNMPVLPAGTLVTISGWGRTITSPGEPLLPSKKLLEARIIIKPKNVCEKNFPGSNTHICGLGEDQAACRGDSGGPLFHGVNRKFYIFGITSFGRHEECDPLELQFYSDVTQAVDWIHSTVIDFEWKWLNPLY